MATASITAVILAGGLGTRLSPVLPDRPKVLAEVRGRPFITYLLNQIAENRMEDVVLCTGYRADQVRKILGNTFGPIHLRYSQEEKPLGTGGALRLALSLISSDTILVMNGDSFAEFSLSEFLKQHLSKAAVATILLTEVEDTERFGRIELDDESRITGFSEKDDRTGFGLINAGVYLMAKKALGKFPEGKALSLERDIFPRLIGKGLYGYPNKGRFIDIGTSESYVHAQYFFQ
jgi:D-glycero-alpha-D-manno-heptose 1-phosphate guanylyltransferase